MLSDLVVLAFSNVRHRGVRSWLTMLGIFIGIAAVVSLISLAQGLQEAVTGQFASIGPDRLVITNVGTGFGPPGSTAIRSLGEHDLELVASVPNVESAIPRLIRVGEVEYNDVADYEYLVSLPKKQEDIDAVYETFTIGVAEGRFIEDSDRGKILLGDDFADSDDFDKPIRVGTTLTIQDRPFEVIGFLDKAGSFQINSAIFMSEEDMRDILDLDDEIDLIAVKVSDKDRVTETAESIERALRKDRKQDLGEEDFSVETPIQALQGVNTVLIVINAIVTGIAAISLLVGGIGITNTMYTSVLERTREIGIMKAIGARNRDILTIFLIESGLLGLVGGIVGATVGLGLAFAASTIAGQALGGIELTVGFSPLLVIGAVVFSCTIGLISGALPALQASRLNTVKALRS